MNVFNCEILAEGIDTSTGTLVIKNDQYMAFWRYCLPKACWIEIQDRRLPPAYFPPTNFVDAVQKEENVFFQKILHQILQFFQILKISWVAKKLGWKKDFLKGKWFYTNCTANLPPLAILKKMFFKKTQISYVFEKPYFSRILSKFAIFSNSEPPSDTNIRTFSNGKSTLKKRFALSGWFFFHI